MFVQRKRYTKDIKCIFFPDDVRNGVKKVGREPTLPTTSTMKSWERCGDRFLDTPVIKVGLYICCYLKLQSQQNLCYVINPFNQSHCYTSQTSSYLQWGIRSGSVSGQNLICGIWHIHNENEVAESNLDHYIFNMNFAIPTLDRPYIQTEKYYLIVLNDIKLTNIVAVRKAWIILQSATLFK